MPRSIEPPLFPFEVGFPFLKEGLDSLEGVFRSHHLDEALPLKREPVLDRSVEAAGPASPRRELGPEQEVFQRLGTADETRQPLGSPEAWDDAEIRFGLAEPR